MTTKAIAQMIRTELKKLGFGSKEVSVRKQDVYAVWVEMKVEVKEESIIEKIRKACYIHQSIDRCDVTGDILEGGNTFIFVNDLNGYRL